MNTSREVYSLASGIWYYGLGCGAFVFLCYYVASYAYSDVGFRAESSDAYTKAQFPDYAIVNTSNDWYPLASGYWGHGCGCGTFTFHCDYSVSYVNMYGIGFRAAISAPSDISPLQQIDIKFNKLFHFD